MTVSMVMVEMGLVVVVVAVTMTMMTVTMVAVVTMDQMVSLVVDHVGVVPKVSSCPIVTMTSLLRHE